jgi:hypothetical protein
MKRTSHLPFPGSQLPDYGKKVTETWIFQQLVSRYNSYKNLQSRTQKKQSTFCQYAVLILYSNEAVIS